MQKMTRFCICKCYFTDNYFITSIKLHLRYEYDEQFRRDYAEVNFFDDWIRKRIWTDSFVLGASRKRSEDRRYFSGSQ